MSTIKSNLPYTDEQLDELFHAGYWHVVDGPRYRSFPIEVPLSRIGVCLSDSANPLSADIAAYVAPLSYLNGIGQDVDVIFVPKAGDGFDLANILLDAGAIPFWADPSLYPSTIVSKYPDREPALVLSGRGDATFFGPLGDAEQPICFFEAAQAMMRIAALFDYRCFGELSIYASDVPFGNKFLPVSQIPGGWNTVFGMFDVLSFGLLPPLSLTEPSPEWGSFYRVEALYHLGLKDFRRRTLKMDENRGPFFANLDPTPFQRAIDIARLWFHFVRDQDDTEFLKKRFDPRDPTALLSQIEIMGDVASARGFEYVVSAYAAGVPLDDLLV